MLGQLRPAMAELVAALPADVRVGVIGGAGGSLAAPGGPRLIDTEGFTDEYKPEAAEAIGILEDLAARGTGAHDWFYVHPAGGFGAWAPGERTGSYRDGGDVLVVGEDGQSFISGPDLAVAVARRDRGAEALARALRGRLRQTRSRQSTRLAVARRRGRGR